MIPRKRSDLDRDLFLAQHGSVITMMGCEWDDIKKTAPMPSSSISPNLYRSSISEIEIINGVKSGSLYGFCVVDIKANSEAEKWQTINWPPIFIRDSIESEMVPDWMPCNERTFPRSTLVQVMKGTEILLHTELLKFYMENGFFVTKVHRFLEYQPGKCFKAYHDALYKLRVEATIEGNSAKATAVKQTGNSSYGKVRLKIGYE